MGKNIYGYGTGTTYGQTGQVSTGYNGGYVMTEKEKNTALTGLMTRVYYMMCMALLLSGAAAWFTAQSPLLLSAIFSSNITFFGLIIVEFVLVYLISAKLESWSSSTLVALFVVYSIINGVTLASIFIVYELGLIASAFCTAALTFGACALVGTFVKKDLSFIGQILFYALIGLIIATIVNIFLGSTGLAAVLNYAGVAIFMGLTIYDTWKIKNSGTHLCEPEMQRRLGVVWALSLYLDFVNLFMYILRIMGSRRD